MIRFLRGALMVALLAWTVIVNIYHAGVYPPPMIDRKDVGSVQWRFYRWACALLIASFIVVGCTHSHVKTFPDGPGLFPYGTYQHNVKIEVLTPPKSMEMHGVVSYSAKFLRVIGLSTFGTTVFRIEEDLVTRAVKKEFFVEVIRQHEFAVMEFYHLIRTLITAPKGATEFIKEGAQFTLSAPDEVGIYRKIELRDPRLILHVEVTDYAL